MKRLVLLILILFSVNVSFAQVKEQLSEKEKARREKNIQAGNPFKRFGYKPKIATLSKGKYLEFHDLDTIMRIGSFVFNTRQKKITGYVNLDTVHSEATLNPQLISRWFSPDPLCEEFPSWSPYNFTMNNPIRFFDPNGKAPEDIIVTSKSGLILFTLDDGKTTITKMTAHELYKTGTQWFEPLADNYMPLKSISAGGFHSDRLKHFTSKEIKKFANKDRWMISYRQGGSGDWKAAEDGADGYLLVEVDGMIYWADAIGQIPFAVDKVTDEIEDGKSPNEAIKTTVQTGKEYGEGKLFGGKTDNSNTYDNYFILRGALYGANGRDFTIPISKDEADKYLKNNNNNDKKDDKK